MKLIIRLMLLAPLAVSGCNHEERQPSATAAVVREPNRRIEQPNLSLPDARKGFQTKLMRREAEKEPVPDPPAQLLRIVRYEAPVGKLPAYLTPDPQDGKKHPAIIWITGGVCNTIGDVWSDAPASNDQTAAAYRKAGIVMMFLALLVVGHDDQLSRLQVLQRFLDPRIGQHVGLGHHRPTPGASARAASSRST